MTRHAVRTGTMVLALTLLGIVGWSPPASAATADLDVVGGMMYVPATALDLWQTSTPPCWDKPSTLRFGTDVPVVGQWTVTGGFTRFFQLSPPNSWYQADFTIAAKGTYTPNGPPVTHYNLSTAGSNHLTFQMRIYEVSFPDCSKNNLKCIIAGRMASGIPSAYYGTLPAAAPYDSVAFSASTGQAGGFNMVTSSCSAPFVSWNGQVAAFSWLHLEVQ